MCDKIPALDSADAVRQHDNPQGVRRMGHEPDARWWDYLIMRSKAESAGSMGLDNC